VKTITDVKIRSGAAKSRMPMKFPAILGRDLSGQVVETGRNVQGFPSEATTDKPTPPEPLTTCPRESETPRSAATVGLQLPGPLPVPGESIDETPIEPEANARIITVEIE
jgi:hypothetical protein